MGWDTDPFGEVRVTSGLWQGTAVGDGGWFGGAGVESNLPGAVGKLLPYCDVSACDENRFTVCVFGASFVVAPGEAHIVRRAHLRGGRCPGELVGFGVPVGGGGYGSPAAEGGAAVGEADGVVGEPGAKRFASTGSYGFGETAFEVEEEQCAGVEGGLGEQTGGGGWGCERIEGGGGWGVGDGWAGLGSEGGDCEEEGCGGDDDAGTHGKNAIGDDSSAGRRWMEPNGQRDTSNKVDILRGCGFCTDSRERGILMEAWTGRTWTSC